MRLAASGLLLVRRTAGESAEIRAAPKRQPPVVRRLAGFGGRTH